MSVTRFSSILMICVVVALAACTSDARDAENDAIALTGGHPARGRQLIEYYGCGSCHVIPGIPGANATIGPPLTAMARRAYIAGVLPNTPDNMERWILNPPLVDPKTAMPITGVKPGEINDIAAYIYTLR